MTTITYSRIGEFTSTVVVPDGSPTYHELLGEIARLKQELAEANKRADDNWEAVEDLATCAGITCPTCGRQRPCLCNDLGEKNI